MSQELFRANFERVLIQRHIKAISLQDAIRDLQQQNYTDSTVIRWQAVAIALLDHINSNYNSELKLITYGDLARRANTIIQSLYGNSNLNLPLRGSALSKQLGSILGILSSLSWRAINIFISAIVVSQNNRLPSEGFRELVFLLTGLYPDSGQLINYQRQVFQVLVTN